METAEMLHAIITKLGQETGKVNEWDSLFRSPDRKVKLNWDEVTWSNVMHAV